LARIFLLFEGTQEIERQKTEGTWREPSKGLILQLELPVLATEECNAMSKEEGRKKRTAGTDARCQDLAIDRLEAKSCASPNQSMPISYLQGVSGSLACNDGKSSHSSLSR